MLKPAQGASLTPLCAEGAIFARVNHGETVSRTIRASVITTDALWQSIRKERFDSIGSFLIHAYTLHLFMLLSND
jgi:hypothetical protein